MEVVADTAGNHGVGTCSAGGRDSTEGEDVKRSGSSGAASTGSGDGRKGKAVCNPRAICLLDSNNDLAVIKHRQGQSYLP